MTWVHEASHTYIHIIYIYVYICIMYIIYIIESLGGPVFWYMYAYLLLTYITCVHTCTLLMYHPIFLIFLHYKIKYDI